MDEFCSQYTQEHFDIYLFDLHLNSKMVIMRPLFAKDVITGLLIKMRLGQFHLEKL
jgi:hypothetical protein